MSRAIVSRAIVSIAIASRATVSTSFGQFNNVLASLLHALALSRLLCRTLLLPGFFVRFGARLTRVSNFEERWRPTSNPDPNPNPSPSPSPSPSPNPNPNQVLQTKGLVSHKRVETLIDRSIHGNAIVMMTLHPPIAKKLVSIIDCAKVSK